MLKLKKLHIGKSTRRLTLLFAALLVLPMVAFTSTASASLADCPADRLCLYEHTYGGGIRITYADNGSGWCSSIPPSMNDKTSSVQNNLYGRTIGLYVNANCQGDYNYWTPGTGSNVMPYGQLFYPSLNDKISSIKFY